MGRVRVLEAVSHSVGTLDNNGTLTITYDAVQGWHADIDESVDWVAAGKYFEAPFKIRYVFCKPSVGGNWEIINTLDSGQWTWHPDNEDLFVFQEVLHPGDNTWGATLADSTHARGDITNNGDAFNLSFYSGGGELTVYAK